MCLSISDAPDGPDMYEGRTVGAFHLSLSNMGKGGGVLPLNIVAVVVVVAAALVIIAICFLASGCGFSV